MNIIYVISSLNNYSISSCFPTIVYHEGMWCSLQTPKLPSIAYILDISMVSFNFTKILPSFLWQTQSTCMSYDRAVFCFALWLKQISKPGCLLTPCYDNGASDWPTVAYHILRNFLASSPSCIIWNKDPQSLIIFNCREISIIWN